MKPSDWPHTFRFCIEKLILLESVFSNLSGDQINFEFLTFHLLCCQFTNCSDNKSYHYKCAMYIN